MEIKVKLFGAMRQYHNNSEITITVKKGSLIKEVRKKIGEKLKRNKSRNFDKTLNDISIAIVDREKTSISLEKAEIFVRDATHGAVTFFLGIVRNHNLKKR